MKIVIDSNVIIAAFAARGLCHALFEYCLESHDVVLSEQIVKEVKRNLTKKIKAPKALVAEVLTYLRESASIEKPLPVDSSVFHDKSDLPVLGVAAASRSPYLITGDKDLLELKKYLDTDIIDPRSFWEAIKKKANN